MDEFELHLLIPEDGEFVNELYDFIDVMDTDSLTDPLDAVGDDGALSDRRENRINDLKGDLTSTLDSTTNLSSPSPLSTNASVMLCGHCRLLPLIRL